MCHRLQFETHVPKWPYRRAPSRLMVRLYAGRLDDFEAVPPAYLTLKIRIALWRVFSWKLRLPARADQWILRRRKPWAMPAPLDNPPKCKLR